MADTQRAALKEMIETAREGRLVDEVQRRGRNVHIAVGGERFTLTPERAEVFLATLLRIGRAQPAAFASGDGEARG